jgi:hypothetical protein
VADLCMLTIIALDAGICIMQSLKQRHAAQHNFCDLTMPYSCSCDLLMAFLSEGVVTVLQDPLALPTGAVCCRNTAAQSVLPSVLLF